MHLFPYQDDGAAYLAARQRALLCDEMGLGKTPQAIRAADLVGAERVLVLAPAAVVPNWQREFQRWQQQHRTVILPRGPADLEAPPGVVVLSYDLARRRGMLNALLARSWDVLIGDEAHFGKEPSAQRSQVLIGPRGDGAGGLVSVAEYAWGLTGTPMPNSADELWALFAAYGPEAIWDEEAGAPISYRTWKRRYCTLIWDPVLGERVKGVRDIEDLRRRMAPVLLRRKKLDVLKDLPPLREDEITLAPGEHLGELRAATAADPEMALLINRILALTLLSDDVEYDVQQMLQGVSDESVSRLRRITAAIKARVLAPLLADEMRGREGKLVVMGWHRETLNVLEAALAPFGAVRLDGQTPRGQRQAAIDSFQADPGTRVFLGQIQAAGTGITLTAAADLVFAEMSWTPAENAQAAMRVHRVGQTQPVLIRFATLAGTVDEAVIRTLRRKSQDIRSVLEGTDE